ncbi:hypothetical protein [Bradyrhizobium sp.]|jgi:hypothetical protein|uniref:hypothetical protein n=1 Tax=Bradyrhizobium sp. TaxID=376 RepID=UPI003C22B870
MNGTIQVPPSRHLELCMFQFCNQNTLLTNVSNYPTVVTSLQQWQFDNSAGKKRSVKQKWMASWFAFIDYVNGKAKLFQD